MIDGGLGKLLQEHLRDVHWQRIETGGTGRGTPDINGCWRGIEIWIELKQATHWQVEIQPEQVAWIERRARAGGRVFVMVRQKRTILWLLRPTAARCLIRGTRLDMIPDAIYRGEGGPSAWQWQRLREAMFAPLGL